MKTKKIGVLGGTFDPVHQGHLKLVQAAKRHLGLNRVVFVPSFRNPLKSKSKTPARHRAGMVRVAIRHVPYATLCLFEIRKKGRSYTVDTLRYLKRRWGSGTEIYFLCGSDVLPQVRAWKQFDQVLKLCRFAVTRRAGAKAPKAVGKLLTFPMKPMPISATQLRKEIARGICSRNSLPAGVLRYIRKYHLYELQQTG